MLRRVRVDVGDVVAVYAAVVATATAGWRIYEWRHSRRAHVVVEPRLALLPLSDGRVETAIVINVHNRGDHVLRVASLGLTAQDGSGRTLQRVELPPGATLPGPVPPRDSAMTYYLLDKARLDAGIDPGRPVEAWATLSTGETFKSSRKPLLRG